MWSIITEHIEIDREQRCVRKDGKAVHLTGLEYGLLDYLTAHANRLCTRLELLDHVWGPRFQYDPGTIDVHLNALRRKLLLHALPLFLLRLHNPACRLLLPLPFRLRCLRRLQKSTS